MYEFKIFEWMATESRKSKPICDLVEELDKHGREGWALCHVHEALREGEVAFVVFMQRKYQG